MNLVVTITADATLYVIFPQALGYAGWDVSLVAHGWERMINLPGFKDIEPWPILVSSSGANSTVMDGIFRKTFRVEPG